MRQAQGGIVIPKITIATIRRHSLAASFDRGQEYYGKGAVGSLIARSNAVSASVEGSTATPYRVQLHFDRGGVTQASCSCPYDSSGWCKHIVATLLTCLHHPEQIEERPELAQLLASLNRDQLQRLIENLAAEQLGWREAIEAQLLQLTAAPSAKSQQATRRTTVDPKPIEQQVRWILDRYTEQWNDEPALDEIREMVQQADEFMAQGDGENALIILRAIIQAYVRDWMNLDGSSGDSGDFFEELDDALTEAILSTEFSPVDRQQWQERLQAWQTEVDDYGIKGFAMSLTALEQGWQYPPLQRVLQGQQATLDWTKPVPGFADHLAQIRLKILERQGDPQAYLHLAKATGQTDRHLQMLAKLGRTAEAIAQANQEMRTTEEALTLAQTLRQQGELEQALAIATQGLTLTGNSKYRLAVWLSDLAEGMEQIAVALQARVTAFKTQPTLLDYLKAQELAGDRWTELRPELLNQLRHQTDVFDASAQVAIFLQEGLIDAAIQTVTSLSSYQSDVIHPVMEAAIAHQPEWVLENARRRAESIMDEGKAKYYYHAINWLRRVRAAYVQLGQQQEWQQYRATLLRTHARKSKLISLLQQRDLA